MAALAGIGVSLSIPPFNPPDNVKDKTTLQKLAGLDYAGATTLVCSPRPPH
jgi:hypothetical protein